MADLPFQLGLLRVIPAPLSEARKSVARPLAELPPPAVQNVGVYLKGPCDLGNRGSRFQPLDSGQFHFTRENSSRQSHDTILHFNENCVLTSCLKNRDKSTESLGFAYATTAALIKSDFRDVGNIFRPAESRGVLESNESNAESWPSRPIGLTRSGDRSTANIVLHIYTGARQLFPNSIRWSAQTLNGRTPASGQQVFHFPNLRGASQVLTVPFFESSGDLYTVTASAKGYEDSTWYPVRVFEAAPVDVRLMMLPRNGVIDFSDATWAKLSESRPGTADIFRRGFESREVAAQYNLLIEARPEPVARFLNAMTALAEIRLPSGRWALDYYWNMGWPPHGPEDKDWLRSVDEVFKGDRLFCYVDRSILDDVLSAVGHSFVAETIRERFGHSGASEKYRQTTFNASNVQLTFYGRNTGVFETSDHTTVTCVKVEVEIDYYDSILSRGFGQPFENWIETKRQDPRLAYALRWMESKRLGLPEFDPLYTVVQPGNMPADIIDSSGRRKRDPGRV